MIRKRSVQNVLAALLVVVLAGCGGDGESETPTVVVALDFVPNAVHAPLYEAARDRDRGDRRARQPAAGRPHRPAGRPPPPGPRGPHCRRLGPSIRPRLPAGDPPTR